MKTIEQFLEELKRTPRTWRVATHSRGIRCGNGDTYQCPLSAVLGVMGVIYGKGYGAIWGLSDEDAKRVADSADEIGDHFDPALRQQLLEACGLEAK